MLSAYRQVDIVLYIKQGQKLSIRTQVKVVIRSEGLKGIFNFIYNFMKKFSTDILTNFD